jgi:hypothetical protein
MPDNVITMRLEYITVIDTDNLAGVSLGGTL